MELRPYQEEAVKRSVEIAKTHGLCYIAAETRVGKTAIVLMAIDRLKTATSQRVLFLTKKKAIDSINGDYAKLGLSYPFYVLSHQSAHKATGRYDFIVVDEAHCAGAYPKPSKLAKNARKLAISASTVFFLSGTPNPESFSSLYHQYYISPRSPWSEYRTFYQWAKHYTKPKTKKICSNMEVKDYSDARVEKIEKDIQGLVVTVTQKEAGFGSEIIEETLTVDMGTQIKQMIRTMRKDKYLKIPTTDGEGEVIGYSSARLKSKIHQLSSGTAKTEKGESVVLSTRKAIAIRDDMKERGITKAVVFYKYMAERASLDIVFGDIVTESVEEFAGRKDAIFVSHYLSGREGIRLDSADHIYMYTVDFAYTSYEQTKNRIQSFERKTIPYLIWVLSDCGICNAVLDTVRKKKSFTSYYFKRLLKTW